ncbi:transmembrane protein 200C-like isoform X1 [Pundamilia nyererei]|uniref:Transmembrane protein 200C-like isoform X1 n=1 Tax=Pundamilia nyererei TaxID=303518 RepID=A0A9Y6JHF4_9CICH|nr:PREDICTED: transmembrane protein 200C-like isoform X1 [Pundamilia nyererei]
MIATGGLLRINARRQDSLSRPHKPHAQKKKKKKRRSEVVVVKGKLKLCSVSGLVAALGILVLVVGVVMAALGYWPRDGLFFSSQPQEGTAMASVSSDTPTTAPADAQVRHYTTDTREVREGVLQSDDVQDNGGSDDGFNQTETINGTTRHLSQGFLQDFLDRYLYSDRLKVFGPLIMGIGIFLFICANAVLHENRDKKTKVINLRDIYSTVIDLHSLRKPNTSSCCSANPPNSIVNYIQSKSLEAKPRAYPDSLINRKGGGEGVGDSGVGGGLLTMQPGSSKGAGEGWGNDGGGHAVFSIYQEQTDAPPPSSSQRLSLPQSFSPTHPSTCWTTKNMLSSFTLPLRRPKPPALQRRHSARARTNQGWRGDKGEEEQQRRDRGDDKPGEEGYGCPPPPQRYSSPPLNRPLQDSLTASCSSSGLYKEAPGGSQALLLLSSSSLTPSHLSLSSFSSTPLPPCRRHSLSTSINITGYSKLKHRDNDSCSSSSHKVISQDRHQMSEEVKSQRKYSNKEKLRMISQKYSGLTQKKDQSGLDSETDSTTQYMTEKH